MSSQKLQPNEQVWKSLKRHIMQKRLLEKQANANEERAKKEKELQKNVKTISEVKDEINTLESDLAKLKSEREELHSKIKKCIQDNYSQHNSLKKAEVRKAPPKKNKTTANGTIQPQMYLPTTTNFFNYDPEVLAAAQTLASNALQISQNSPVSSHSNYGFVPPLSSPILVSTPSPAEEASRWSRDSRAVLWHNPNTFSGYGYFGPGAGQYNFGHPTPFGPPPLVHAPRHVIPEYYPAALVPALQMVPPINNQMYFLPQRPPLITGPEVRTTHPAILPPHSLYSPMPPVTYEDPNVTMARLYGHPPGYHPWM